jgi:serine/threonine protein kinase
MACCIGEGHAMDNREEAGEPDGDESSAALLRVPVLERQVAALGRVVAIERRLRELSKARTSVHASAAVAPPFPQSDDATVVTKQRWELVGEDSTRPSRSPIDDSTVLHRNANPTYGAAEPMAQTPASNALVLAPGSQLFEYRIDSVLGQGGFGITYLATDIHLNAKVAIKEYLPAGYAQRSGDKSVWPRWPDEAPIYQAGLDRFLVEVRILATFRHRNIVRVARFFEANRTAYMVLEYERGKSLKQWWPGRKRVREAELLGLLQPLLDGLAVVHAAGFLHRAIKPDNIYVRKDDGSLVLLDFGAARQAVGHAGALADVVTPGYAPPEQYDNGAQGPWTDIYSLGATLYWMITGTKPPEAPARISGAAQMTPAQQADKEQFSDAFLAAVDWALQPDPAARPQDLRAFSQKLFASHAGSLALRDALNDGEAAPRFASESFRARINSPRLFARRSLHFLRALLHPASWPMVAKMAAAMVLAALLPMLITAYYNLNGSVEAVSAGEMRNLTRMA